MVEVDHQSLGQSLDQLSLLRKWRRCWAFAVAEAVFLPHDGSSHTVYAPKTLKLEALFTSSFPMRSENRQGCPALRKSTITSLVFFVLRVGLNDLWNNRIVIILTNIAIVI